MNLSPVQFYSYFITFRGHEPKVVDRGDVHVLFVDEPWPSITVLVLWTFWLSCSAFQFFGHLRKNVGLALGCHCCSVAQSYPALCDPMNCSTPVFPSPISSVQFRSVQSLSHIWLSATLWIAAHQASLSITNSWSLPKLMSIKSVMPSSHLMLCHPLLLLPQSLPGSGSFPMSQFFASGGQSIGVCASASALMNTQDWSPSGWTGWISFQSKGLSRVFSNTTVQKHQLFGTHCPTLTSIHDYWKNHSLD